MPCSDQGYEKMSREKRQKVGKALKERLTYMCNKLDKAGRLEELASIRIVRWHKGRNHTLEAMGAQARHNWFTQNVCFLCANLISAECLQDFTYKRIREWHRKYHNNNTKKVRKTIIKRFKDDPQLLSTMETIGSVTEDFIADAEEVHPLSDFHRGWFANLVSEEAEKIITNNTKIAEEARHLQEARDALTLEQRAAAGI